MIKKVVAVYSCIGLIEWTSWWLLEAFLCRRVNCKPVIRILSTLPPPLSIPSSTRWILRSSCPSLKKILPIQRDSPEDRSLPNRISSLTSTLSLWTNSFDPIKLLYLLSSSYHFLVSGVSDLLFTHVTYQIYGSLFRVADAGIHRELYPVSDSEGILSNSLLQRSWFPSLWDTHQWTWLDCQLVSCVSLSIFNE